MSKASSSCLLKSAAILLSICASMVHAQSSTQLYGGVDAGIGSFKTSGGVRTTQQYSGGMTTSYFGLKGGEDLGGGLRAFFTLEAYFRADTGEAGRFGGDAFFSRASNVGVGGDFGVLLLGRMATLLFAHTAGFNPLGASFGFSPLIRNTYGAGTRVSGDAAWNNALGYQSPVWQGISVNALYGLKEVGGGRNVSLGVRYVRGSLAVGGVVQAVKSPFAAGEEKTYQLGGSYDLGVVKLFATHGEVRRREMPGLPAGGTDNPISQLGASMPAGGSGTVMASWSRAGDDATAPGTRSFATIGYSHRLSKRTDVYLMLMTDKAQAQDRAQSTAVGIRHAF